MGKERMREKKRLLCIALSSCLLLTGCGLLPMEETRPTLVVETVEPIDYSVEAVKREDLVNSKYIYCTYVQLLDENLSFGLGDKKIEKVYVEVGSTVKKGDLLAELSQSNVEEETRELEFLIEMNKEKLEFTRTQMNLELEKEEKLYSLKGLTEEEYNQNTLLIKNKYKDVINNYIDTIYIDELKLHSLFEARSNGQIYAGMDGIVSFVKGNLEGSLSKKGEDIIRIIDNTLCAFRVETEFSPYFIEGETVQIEMRMGGGQIYEAVVSHDKESPGVVYFELTEPNFTLSVGDRGSINLILEEKKDVLTISKKALRKAENFNYVYYINEDGIRSMKEVTTGMAGNESVEITSGLEFGELVITR